MQGLRLADTFTVLCMPFDSPATKELNIQISETTYHASLESGSEMAEWEGHMDVPTSAHAAKTTTSTAPLAVWHSRLGHANTESARR